MPTRVLRWFAACQGRGPGSGLFWSTTQPFTIRIFPAQSWEKTPGSHAATLMDYAEDEIPSLTSLLACLSPFDFNRILTYALN